jgi:hypothetical protein
MTVIIETSSSSRRAQRPGDYARNISGSPLASSLRPASRSRQIHDDTQHPGPKRGPALVSVQGTHHRQPRLLDDLLRDGPNLDLRERETQHHAAPALDELAEHLLVAVSQRFQQRLIVAGCVDPTRGVPEVWTH